MSLRRGFWRVTFIVHLAGTVVLALFVEPPPTGSPFRDACAETPLVSADGVIRPNAYLPEECRIEWPAELEPEGRIERLAGVLAEELGEFAPEIVRDWGKERAELHRARVEFAQANQPRVPIWRSAGYADTWIQFAIAQAIWAAVTWGPFYLLVWIRLGFAPRADS